MNYLKSKIHLKKLYSEYQKLGQKNPFSLNGFFDKLPFSVKDVTSEVHDFINVAIANEDKNLLHFAVNIAYRGGIDNSYSKLIAQLLTATWHNEHEDLVDTICLENLNDDIFTASLYQIAIKPDLYRKYDDETESTLRKCIHALKMINSENAIACIEKLKTTKNSNVDVVLSMYNE